MLVLSLLITSTIEMGIWNRLKESETDEELHDGRTTIPLSSFVCAMRNVELTSRIFQDSKHLAIWALENSNKTNKTKKITRNNHAARNRHTHTHTLHNGGSLGKSPLSPCISSTSFIQKSYSSSCSNARSNSCRYSFAAVVVVVFFFCHNQNRIT